MKRKIFDKTNVNPRKRRIHVSSRNTDSLCPICMSSLTRDTQGDKQCTGDRLRLWEKQLEAYEKLNKEQKLNYLQSLGNSDKFLELYEKRNNLECGFNTKFTQMLPDNRVRIPDPMIVTSIQRKLGRHLTEEELEEGFEVEVDGKKRRIPRVIFPDEC